MQGLYLRFHWASHEPPYRWVCLTLAVRTGDGVGVRRGGGGLGGGGGAGLGLGLREPNGLKLGLRAFCLALSVAAGRAGLWERRLLSLHERARGDGILITPQTPICVTQLQSHCYTQRHNLSEAAQQQRH